MPLRGHLHVGWGGEPEKASMGSDEHSLESVELMNNLFCGSVGALHARDVTVMSSCLSELGPGVWPSGKETTCKI